MGFLFEFVNCMNSNPFFQFISAAIGIIGALISLVTFLKTKNVQNTLRDIRIEQTKKRYFSPKLKGAQGSIQGFAESLQGKANEIGKKNIEYNPRELIGFQTMEKALTVIRRSIQRNHTWFENDTHYHKSLELIKLRVILKRIDCLVYKSVLDYKKTVKLEKLFTQLCEVLDEEMHYEQEERSQTI